MRIVCIDDEHLALRYIERQLSKITGTEVIGTFTNPLEGKAFILQQEPDVVFLDIDMSPINGMEIAERILEEKPGIIIVFVTAYDEYAVEAFELNAIDYIVKPLRFERLEVTIKRIRKELHSKKERVIQHHENLQIKTAPILSFQVKPGLFEPLPWRTAKSQELFIYLLQNNGVVIEKSAIIELLWADYELERAYSLLYTTIYNIRKQMKPFQEHIVLHNHSYGYLLELKQVEVDQETWIYELESLSSLNGKSISEYERVMDLYNGPYFANYDYTWLEAERYRLEQRWMQVADQLASYYKRTGKLTDAIRWYHMILEKDPAIEEAHFQLMKLYEAKGDFTAMMQQYNVLHRVWRQHFDIKPSEYIKDWYLEKLK